MDQAERTYRVRGEWFLFPPGTFREDHAAVYRQTRIAELKRERQTLRQRIQEPERQVAYLVRELNQAEGS
jgi:hypothetical protein